MKQNFKNYLKLGILLFGISLIVVSCLEDDVRTFENETEPHKRHGEIINTSKIPHILEHISNKTNGTYKYIIGENSITPLTSSFSYRGENLFGEVDASKAIQVNNENNTKYSFNIKGPNNTTEFINLVVVETTNELKDYYIKYIPDPIWLQEQGGKLSMQHFTGRMVVYDFNGEEIGSIDFIDGNSEEMDNDSPPCDDTTNDGTNGTNETETEGETGGTGGYSDNNNENGSNENNNSSGGGNGGGGNCVGVSLTLEMCCNNNPELHPPDECGCVPQTGTILYIDFGYIPCTESFAAFRTPLEGLNPCDGNVGVLIEVEDDCTTTNEDFNAFYTEHSPFNVDLSEVRKDCNLSTIDTVNVAQNEKFMCIYNKLIQSPKFKNLFIDTFGESENLNVTFKVSDTISSAGRIVPGTLSIDPTNGQITSANMEILISKEYMESSSAIAVAKTILHESIHAFLMVKHYGCDQSTPFENMGDEELSELLNEYFLECEPLQGQHEFMFNFMIPTMADILTDLKNDLIPLNHQQSAEQQMFINEDNPTIDELGEFVKDVPWSWDEFNKYLSLAGLQNSSAFSFAYPDNPPSVGYLNYLDYKDTGINSFRKECTN